MTTHARKKPSLAPSLPTIMLLLVLLFLAAHVLAAYGRQHRPIIHVVNQIGRLVAGEWN